MAMTGTWQPASHASTCRCGRPLKARSHMNNKYTWQSMAHAVPPITITTSDEQSEVSDNTDDPDFVPSLHPSRPLVRHATAPNAAKAPKRSKRPEPSPTLKALFARAYTSVHAIKDQLREWNPNCIPRVRSCSGLKGRNVRFRFLIRSRGIQ